MSSPKVTCLTRNSRRVARTVPTLRPVRRPSRGSALRTMYSPRTADRCTIRSHISR